MSPEPADPEQVASTQAFLRRLRADGPSSEAPATNFQRLGDEEIGSTQVEPDAANA